MKRLAALGACLLILFSPLPAWPGEALGGQVIRVTDGDTVTVATDDGKVEQVRYIGIDCPETHHPRRRVEELGREASQYNESLVLGKRVLLEFDQQRRDRYGRTLAYLWLTGEGGAVMVNELLVAEGYALPYAFPPNLRYTGLFREAFNRARSSGKGLWGRARGRLFTPAQVWAELPSVAGRFITVNFKVRDVTSSKTRVCLRSDKGNASLVVYESDTGQFDRLEKYAGSTLTIMGKVTPGFNGPEILLVDPAQILSIR